MVRQVGRAVDMLLLVALALLLIAKVLLVSGVLAPWRGQIDTALFAVLGLYGLLVGMRNRREVMGVLAVLAGAFLVVMPFIQPFDGLVYVTVGAVVLVLIAAIFLPRRKRS